MFNAVNLVEMNWHMLLLGNDTKVTMMIRVGLMDYWVGINFLVDITYVYWVLMTRELTYVFFLCN